MSAATLGHRVIESTGTAAPAAVATATGRSRREPNSWVIVLTVLVATGGLLAIAPVRNLLVDLVLAAVWHSAEIALGLALALAANGFVMWRRERHTLANLLPLVAAGGILGAMITALVFLTIGQEWAYVVGLLGFLTIAWTAALFAAFLLVLAVSPRLASLRHADYVVVLGCGLVDGRVSPLLASRVKRGVDVVRRERSRGREALLVLSGGQGADEPRSEASAMAEYAAELGIAEAWMRREERSRTTEQNLRFTREIVAAELGADARGLVVTSDYHAVRAGLISRTVGLDAPAIGARTAAYFRPSAVMREFVALVVRFRKAAVAVTALVVLPLPTLYAVLLFA